MAFKIRSILGLKEPGQEETTVTSEPLATPDSGKKSSPDLKGAEGLEPQAVELIDGKSEVEAPKPAPVPLEAKASEERDEPTNEKTQTESSPRGDRLSEAPRPQRTRPKNVEELFLKSVPERAQSATENLKSILTQTVLFDIVPSGRKYLFEWSAKGCTVVETKETEAKCTVQIHEKDVMKVADGDLNPQVLMLSHKAKVTGDARSATYVFNLIAPYPNL